MPNVGIRPYVWMMSGCFWFTLMVLFTGAVKDDCDWQLVAVARGALAFVFALTLALVLGARLVFAGTGVLWMRSVAGSCSMVSTFYALTHMRGSEVLTITNTFPLWVALLSWPLAGERPTLGVMGAVVCSITGVALTQQASLADLPTAAWSALAASGFTAVAMLGLNRLRGVSPLGIVVHFSGVATVFCAASYFVFDHSDVPVRRLDWTTAGKLLGVGASATVGQVFLTLAFRSGSATKVSVVGLSQVVMVMAAERIGGHHFEWSQILGTVLVLGPTGWLMAREHRLPRKGSEPPVEEVAIE